MLNGLVLSIQSCWKLSGFYSYAALYDITRFPMCLRGSGAGASMLILRLIEDSAIVTISRWQQNPAIAETP
jgi:hypothetical protein